MTQSTEAPLHTVARPGWCIGGPLAGSWHDAARGEPYFRAEHARPLRTLALAGDVAVSEVMRVTTYTPRSVMTATRTFHFWVPEEMTDAQAMDLLVRGYAQNISRGRRP